MKGCRHVVWIPLLFGGGAPVTTGDRRYVEFSLCEDCGALRIVTFADAMTSTSIYFRDQPNTV